MYFKDNSKSSINLLKLTRETNMSLNKCVSNFIDTDIIFTTAVQHFVSEYNFISF